MSVQKPKPRHINGYARKFLCYVTLRNMVTHVKIRFVRYVT